MILMKYLLTAFRDKLKEKILGKAINFLIGPVFGWGGRSTANQHLFKVGLSLNPLVVSAVAQLVEI